MVLVVLASPTHSQALLARQLRDFRDGKRKDPTMNGIASSLTDEQILALAQRFSAGPKR
jgi:cytochrome c553